jgi:ABC-type transporter MlaC component
MRPNGAGTLVIVVLVSASLMTGAAAQERRGPGGGAPAAGPRVSAPAPHFSAPAPHFAAPAPHFSAPAAPAPRIIPAPQIAAPRIIAAPRFTPPLGNVQIGPGNARTGEAGNLAHGGMASPNTATPNIVGQGLTGGNRGGRGPSQNLNTVGHGAAEPSQNVIQGRNGWQVLRNPALANISAHDPANRALAQSTFSGRFARSGLGRDHDRDRDRGRNHDGDHRHFGRVIGFFGPVFWPYAYDDFVDYTFSPYAYDTFWPYAYDDVFQGIYGASARGYSDDASGGAVFGYADGSVGYVRATGGTAQICSGQTEGLTDFPIQQITQQVRPDQDQQALLDDLRAATATALDVLRAACPSDLPSTPTGRLAAMHDRVKAMLEALRAARPALEKFYRSLSDEQKESFNALDAENFRTAESGQSDSAQVCGGSAAQATNLPFARIEQALRLSDAQVTALKALEEASAKAGDILKANCPTETMLTPTGRLAAMEQRLDAMLQALDTVQPALATFYGSLDDEQKARFNRIGARST